MTERKKARRRIRVVARQEVVVPVPVAGAGPFASPGHSASRSPWLFNRSRGRRP